MKYSYICTNEYITLIIFNVFLIKVCDAAGPAAPGWCASPFATRATRVLLGVLLHVHILLRQSTTSRRCFRARCRKPSLTRLLNINYVGIHWVNLL